MPREVMSRSLLERIKVQMTRGFFDCFGDPVNCASATSDNPKCPLYESCLARFSELLKWEARVEQKFKEITEGRQ